MEEIEVSREVYEAIDGMASRLNEADPKSHTHDEIIQILLTCMIPPLEVKL